MIRHILTCIVLIVAATMTPAMANTEPLINHCGDPGVRFTVHEDGKRITYKRPMSVGTATTVGEALVTNYHVVQECADDPSKVIAYDAVLDLALIRDGDPGECVTAAIGTPAFARGTQYNDDTGISVQATSTGVVKRLYESELVAYLYDSDGVRLKDDYGNYKTVHVGYFDEIVITQDEHIVTHGFSGGEMFTIENGIERQTGILDSSNEDFVIGTPIESVCEFIRNNRSAS